MSSRHADIHPEAIAEAQAATQWYRERSPSADAKPAGLIHSFGKTELKGKNMSFVQESTGYEKTILSDLQGAWISLRASVVDAAGFEGWDRATFHIDEAMSWESVRNLRRMPPLLLIIRNICLQGNAPEEVIENSREDRATQVTDWGTVDNKIMDEMSAPEHECVMPRVPRLGTPGLLHEIMIRGIGRRSIFQQNR
jgi:hypothetical protein